MKNLIYIVLLVLTTLSCSDVVPSVYGESDLPGEVGHDMIELGARLDDPYSVDNMSKALCSLYPTKADRMDLEPTDLYVRFLPRDENEYDRLCSMGLLLLDHPVDFEIVREGDYYQDPEIGDDGITWQYTVVRKDFNFPAGIRYEVLDKCFIPENASTKSGEFDWEEVERESFRLTGNERMLSASTRAGSGAPSGRITLVDDMTGKEEGLRGVRVSCNVFVKFASAYTDEDGNYAMTRSFSSRPRYRIVFSNRKGFGIGFNLIFQPASASTLGRGSTAGMDYKVSTYSDRKLYTRSVVNNAAYGYYESCEREGMTAPPANLRIWLFQNLSVSSAVMLQQGAIVDNSIIGRYLGDYSFLLKMFLPDITLGLKDCYSFGDIYSSTVHELAHASHFMKVGKDYWDKYIIYIIRSFVTSGFVTYGVGTEDDHGYCEVGEMWAYFVQSQMFNERYDKDMIFGTSFWFSPQIFVRLSDKGLNRAQIFGALSPDVIDRNKLQSKLVSLYPQFRSTINQAFGRYN